VLAAAALVVSLAALSGGCRRLVTSQQGASDLTAAVTPRASNSSVLTVSLPERIDTFKGEPVVSAGAALRRTYVRGETRITVTVARLPMSSEQYARWVKDSVEGFPQAALDLPTGAGNGFYQCSSGARPSCDLLIQLRSGYHIEIRSGGAASRADADTIALGLQLESLSTR
jgi:hypothetical protein